MPELCEGFAGTLAEALLSDRHHGVLLAACTLATEMCEKDAEVQTRMRSQVPQLCKVLKSLIYAGKSAEHDIAGHADPFLQVAILRLLRVLGRGDADASDAMSDILAQIASNTDGSKNAGNAILYEAVETIIAIEAVGGLRVLAVNILGRVLAEQGQQHSLRGAEHARQGGRGGYASDSASSLNHSELREGRRCDDSQKRVATRVQFGERQERHHVDG